MDINVLPASTFLLKVVSIVFTIAVPVVSAYIVNRLHVQKNGQAASGVNALVSIAAKYALNELKVLVDDNPTAVIKNAAIEKAYQIIEPSLKEAFTVLKLTPDSVAKMIGGELETLLSTVKKG